MGQKSNGKVRGRNIMQPRLDGVCQPQVGANLCSTNRPWVSLDLETLDCSQVSTNIKGERRVQVKLD